jgi:hypothetical protein
MAAGGGGADARPHKVVENHLAGALYGAMHLLPSPPRMMPDEMLAFDAEDATGQFELWVPLMTWERLRAEAPWPADVEDQRDYALGMLEVMADDLVPQSGQANGRVLRL